MQGLKQEKEKIGDVSSLCLSLSLFICLCFLTGISCLNGLAVLLISFFNLLQCFSTGAGLTILFSFPPPHTRGVWIWEGDGLLKGF